MTAEVAVMNRAALVFAADSATTVTYWSKGERQTRYFKGANKLFQLSCDHPVGLMINGSASLQDVPWEILTKDYRETQKDACFSKLREYADHFFEFVGRHAEIFPPDLLKRAFLDAAAVAAYVLLDVTEKQSEVAAADSTEKAKARGDFLRKHADSLKALAAPPHLTAEEISGLIAEHQTDLIKELFEGENALDRDLLDGGPELLSEIAVLESVKNYVQYQDLTGVIVGGYGKDEFFPSVEVFDCYGFVGKRLCVSRDNGKSRKIDGANRAAIEPFATTSMINTFRMGISPDVFGNVIAANKKSLEDLATSISAELDLKEPIPNLDELITKASQENQDTWFHSARENHYGPLAKVVGSLPITDMAALAKSLIELQSLKERVTEPSESVAGPIDVAVITKHDGLVWIERKHYFRPEFNSRFFERQSKRAES